MNEIEAVLAATETFVRERLAGESTGHDWWHTERVTRLARRIALTEGADLTVVHLAALLHDVADWKFSGDEEASGRESRAWLTSQGIDVAVIDHITEIINTLSFKSADQPRMRTLEGQVVQDADRLDALGAIGIGRTFAYGGWKGTPMYDPQAPPRLGMSGAEYRAHVGTTINHFYEKLLLLRDLMNTTAGRQLAEGRHRYLEGFLEQFLAEWVGER